MPDWNDYRYFVAVAKAGTLAGAARSLKVDQTTCGRRIQALEDTLGARLFDRTSDGLQLTAAGERALAHAREMEEAAEALERRVAGVDERLDGTVRVAASETLAVGFLVHDLAAFHVRHPGITIEVFTGAASVNLLKREADLAVRVAPRPTQANLIARKLTDMGWALYASPDYLVRRPVRGSLETHALIGFDDDMAQIPAARWMEQHLHADRVLRLNSILAATEAVAAGFGAGPLPCFLGDARGLTRLEAPAIPSAECWLVVHPDLEKTPRVRAVMDFLIELFTRDGARFRG